MKHSRIDYEPIQAPVDLIPADEPVFLLRATDIVAPSAIEAWAAMAENAGASKEVVQSARDHAAVMREYGKTHGRKVPDMPGVTS